MTDIQTGFPKNLAYNLKKLDAGFSKTKVKILPDTQTAQANGIVRFRLTGNSIYDFRSLVLYMTGATAGASATPAGLFLHFPRYASSLIQNISITANNTVLCSINEYGTLYNALMDMEGGDYSQTSKRCTEYFDPTIRFSSQTGAGVAENRISAGRLVDSAAVNSNDTGVNMCINNFLGFLNSLSTSCIDLSDWGDLYINIQFAPATVLWHSNFPNGTDPAAVPTFAGANFTLSNIFLTIDKISFQSPDYYNLKTEKLLDDGGLTVAYYDYYLVAGSLATKSSGVSMNFNVNSSSLDQCIATFRRSDYNQNKPLVMYGSLGIGPNNLISLDEYNANPVARTNNIAGATALGMVDIGDGFANSIAFVRAGNDLVSSQWSVNSVNIDPYPQTPIEIWNKDLQYLGFMNQDLGSSGVHVGCKSLIHFLKYYFIDICSLENISGDNSMWVSGLDGRQGGINIQYNATFASTNAQTVYPLVWCRSTRVLQIKAGRQLVLDPPSM